jgi:hypothetical protein
MQCEKLEGCLFYLEKMPIESSLGKLFVKTYCEGDKSLCARYRVSTTVGKEYVTSSLYPNMNELADQIIKEHS